MHSAQRSVTVVIPSRDRPDFVERAVATALAQIDVSVDVVVVDDGSDPALSLRRFDDSRIQIIRHERSRGLAAARNAGMRLVTAEWTAFLDDDDLWAPHKLSRQLAVASASRAEFVYADAVVVDACGTVLGTAPATEPTMLAAALRRHNVMPAGSSNVVVRTGVLCETGGFDEQFQQLADWDLWIRLAERGSAAYCAETLVAYVQHPGSMLAGATASIWAEFEFLRHKSLMAGSCDVPSMLSPEFLRWVAWGHRRAGEKPAATRLYLRSVMRGGGVRDLARAVGINFGESVMQRLARRGSRVAPPDWLDDQLGSGRAAGDMSDQRIRSASREVDRGEG